MPAVSLLIIDSNSTFRNAAELYLTRRAEIRTVKTAASAKEAFQIVRQLKPEMILIDVKLLVESRPCRKICAELKMQAPGALILVLTLFGDSLMYSRFPEIELISGFIAKEDFAETLIPLIRDHRGAGGQAPAAVYPGEIETR